MRLDRAVFALAAIVLLAGIGPGSELARSQSADRPARDTSAQPNASATERQASGLVMGRVIAGDSGRPVRRATVRINGSDPPIAHSSQTDDAGAFEFTGLPAGRYIVTAAKSGFVTLSYGQRRPLQPGTPLQLADGQQLRGVDFRLPRGSVIAGRVFADDGDPAPGVTVRALRYQYAQGARQLVPAGVSQTDDRGAYRLWGLNPGEYFLSATAPGGNLGGGGVGGGIARGAVSAPLPGRGGPGRGGPFAGAFPGFQALLDGQAGNPETAYAPTYYPGVATAAEARGVMVGLSTEQADVDFALLLVRTSLVSGRATSSDGSSIAGGAVNLVADDGTSGGRGSMLATYGGRLNWDGAFAIPNVPPGRYLLHARANVNGAPVFAAQALSVSGSDTSIALTLAAGGIVRGTVRLVNEQTIVVPDVTQFRVTAPPADGAVFGGTPAARVERDGTFTLDGIPPGARFIRAQAPRGWALREVVADGRDLIDTALDVRSGQQIADLTLVFTDKLSEINGRIADTRGIPITEYTILAFPTDAAMWRPDTRQIMTTRPDQNGRFQIRGLPRGDYYLAPIDPSEPGEWFDPSFLDRQRTGAAHITLGDGDVKTHDFTVATP